ncbi:LacI family DNA-binding transcriptional regulator [Fictibacillus phosphorivorans]|uniref:LacI family DNA-binding transcriptional regulator n=1 Tax=Fictibacillus phosphorivorans TaxID=1221500 RepID=UPI001292FF29|nr:LacI family DNA-binding transcriptional regulator [Fictibacillus phosphorivorans]MQR94453.1 LacI family transcriptional regulator [Fictibacillus phosphorivorans]
MAVNMKEVALKANVSTATVSHVINETRYVAEETKQKVFQAMKELNYRPNPVARNLRSRKSNIIGLIIPVQSDDTSNFFFMSIAHGIGSVLKRYGYQLIVSNTNEELNMEREQITMFNDQFIDGLIMAPTSQSHEFLHQELNGDYPVVFIDRKPEGYDKGDFILSDGKKGTYEAIKLLLSKGHKKIAFITGPLGISTSDERLEGYKQALLEQGMKLDDTLIKEAVPTLENGYNLTKELLSSSEISAVLTANNVMTMGVVKCLQDHKKVIPTDVAVIGFDDYEWAKITTPSLTMIKQPSFELGVKAAEAILRRIEDPDADFIEMRLQTEIIQRDSC